MAEDTESVSAGEVCSLAVASDITVAIRDTNNPTNGYYLADYSDVKTYNDAHDRIYNLNTYRLCETIDSTDTKAAPLCVLQSNAGIGFTKKQSPGSIIYDRCVTAECPEGFTVDPKNPNSCKKPRKPKTTLLNNIVEERWYDWFMVPDYHLGNKYTRAGNKNFAPCKKGSIPSYETDPVDGLQKSFNSSNKDDLEKCVEKAQYFGGKYFRSETHCPLTWVYRVGATNKDLKRMYDDLINDIDERGNKNLDILKKEKVDGIIYEEIYKPVIKYGFDDYIGEPQTEEAKAACAKLDNANPERKNKAFTICNTIHQLGKVDYIKKLMRENKEDEATAKQKYKRAIQACHTLFCKDEGTQKLCFADVEKTNFDKYYTTKTEPEPYVIDLEKEKKKVASQFVYVLIFIVSAFACLVALIIGYPFLKKAGPFLKDVYYTILSWAIPGYLKPGFSKI